MWLASTAGIEEAPGSASPSRPPVADGEVVKQSMAELSRRLGERGGHLANESGETLEGMMQRQDAQAEHRTLQLADQPLQQQVLVLEFDRQLAGIHGVLRPLSRMADGVLGDQQFAGQPDQRIDPVDVDPQGDIG